MEPEIKRLYRVQTINSILNLEASGGERRKKQNKLRWSQDLALHMLIIYLGGSTGLARIKACVVME